MRHNATGETDLLVALGGVAAFYGLLDPAGNIRDAGGALLSTADLQIEALRGLPLWRAPWWPDDPAVHAAIEADVAEAAAGGIAQREAMAQAGPGGPLPLVHRIAPVRDSDGRIVELAVLAIDVPPQNPDPKTRHWSATGRAATAHEALRRVLDATGAMVVALDADGTVRQANRTLIEACGPAAETIAGKPVWDCAIWAEPETAARRGNAIPPVSVTDRLRSAVRRAADGVAERFDAAMSSGMGGMRDVEVQIRPTGGGGDGNARMLVMTCLDVSGRKGAVLRARFLADEATHRSKNILGVVQSIARQMGGYHFNDFAEAFGDRLQSLARAQDFLLASDHAPVPLGALIRAQLAHFSHLFGTGIVLDGPEDVLLTTHATQSLAIAINELATNAEKYGALSVPDGRVRLSWGLDDGEFWVEWRESGGPPVTVPARSGFGLFVLEEVTARNLRADVVCDWAESGLVWRILASGRSAVDQQAVAGAPVAPARGERRCVLIAEDEPMLAHELAEALRAAGYTVEGPAGTLDEALDLARKGICTAAILDLNLGGKRADCVAEYMLGQGHPVVLVSAYPESAWSDAVRGVPYLAKPVDFRLLIDTLNGLARAT